jgi:guanine nucleotide-binding protein G(i) subunit alpha
MNTMRKYDDGSLSRLEEPVDLFREVARSHWFRSTVMLVFMNKTDLFKEKLKTVPLKDHFSDYLGDNSFDSAFRLKRNFL